MNNKGYTLIEVILAIAIIGLLAVSFLPLMTFSYTNLVGSEKFTNAMLEDQSIVEKEIDNLRFTSPPNPGSSYKEAFNVNIPVHELSVNTTSSGQVKVYLPKQTEVPIIPIIKSPPVLIVRANNDSNIIPQPDNIHIFDDPYKLFVADVDITDATENEHLMNVYRWYTSAEIYHEEDASETTDDYVVVREWNEAKTVVSYSEALDKGFIPNMKEHIDLNLGKEQYNEFNYKILKNAYSFTDEQMINNFGNRYLKYGVTPYSLTGRMGVEKLSNAIYIEAPKIEISSIDFGVDENDDENNTIIITFSIPIEDTISASAIFLNEDLDEPVDIYRYEDENEEEEDDKHKKLILKFKPPIDTSAEINGNFLARGAVISKEYGAITIWSNNNPNGDFIIPAE